MEEATTARRCPGYFKYVPGWSPDLHRSLILRREDRRHDRVNNAIFALFGALLALAAQYLSKILGLTSP